MSDEPAAGRPGWYPHPTDSMEERWWDGRAWTAHTRPQHVSTGQPRNVFAVTPEDKRRRGVPVVAVVAIAVGALVIGAVGGAVAGSTAGAIARAPKAAGATSDAAARADEAAPSKEPSQAFQYSAEMFAITLKTTSKECFGSSGCVLNVKPALSPVDTSAIPEDASGSLTYEITGGDDGTVTETTDLTGTSYSIEQSTIQTSSSSTKLKVKITDVETNAG